MLVHCYGYLYENEWSLLFRESMCVGLEIISSHSPLKSIAQIRSSTTIWRQMHSSPLNLPLIINMAINTRLYYPYLSTVVDETVHILLHLFATKMASRRQKSMHFLWFVFLSFELTRMALLLVVQRFQIAQQNRTTMSHASGPFPPLSFSRFLAAGNCRVMNHVRQSERL